MISVSVKKNKGGFKTEQSNKICIISSIGWYTWLLVRKFDGGYADSDDVCRGRYYFWMEFNKQDFWSGYS